jgi:hypothetical protein
MSAKRVVLLFGGLIVAAVGVFYCWPPRLIDDGGFDLLVAKRSPTGSKVAEVFAYRGGATVRGFSILLVRPSDREISPEDFSARVADCEGVGRIEVSWQGDERLLVWFPTTEHRLLKQTAFGVAIEERRIE